MRDSLRRLLQGWALLAGCAVLAVPLGLQAVEGHRSPTVLDAYDQARAKLERDPQNVEAGWRFARACFDLADSATNRTERAAIAQQGIAACRQALLQDPNCAPAHYYLGLDLGELARTRGLGALRLVDQMEHEFMRAIKLDPNFDYAGAERSLGLLYRDAPSLLSIGSKSKARQHLQRAVQLAPQYPENRLDLLESELKWHDRKGALQQLTALEALWPEAKKQFSGPAWQSTWTDWDQRLQEAKQKLE